ncbi:glycosyltransferase [Psychrilyobacter atlanticus]|uniref:glycosyltransferase n=1 Tax=Psychrilyobacter atlanticus TaxID=271091 RepID=UPI00048C4194|nr:glycosyltransferase [Psychrilyobacter atlanticus]
MKDILIIANYIYTPEEQGNCRFNYLAKLLSKENSVEICSSNFSHPQKKHRKNIRLQNKLSYKITLLNEVGYTKNISLKRFLSHYLLSRNLELFLKKRKTPDVIYCSLPSLSFAKCAARYAKKNNIKFIIDIQDLWPEAFKMAFNPFGIGKIIYEPFRRQANYIYRSADEIVAVSNTYLERALKVNNKIEKGHSVFLGTDLSDFDKFKNKKVCIDKKAGEVWITYLGTLGYSYDLLSVIDSISILNVKGFKNIKFIVIGDGPLRSDFEKYAKKKDICIEFTGALEYGNMVKVLKKCDIAVNPIKAGSAGSIINKVGDYAAAELPVLNTQESLEYRKLVDKFNIGINCINNNSEDLAKNLLILLKDKKLRKNMGRNNRKLAENKFDRKLTYKKILDLF